MICIEKVTKSFPSKVVFSNVSITIKDKSIFGLVGINGAGKSTFLRCLTNVYNFDEGKVLIDNYDSSEAEAKNNIFFLNDDPFFLRTDTPLTLANFYKAFYPNFDEHYYRNMLTSLKIEEKGKVVNFSKGMRRQLFLAIAFSTNCKYVFLDEAFDGLDPLTRIIIKKKILEKVEENNLTVIITSHSLKDLEEIADSFAILDKTHLIDYGNINDKLEDFYKFQIAFDHDFDLSTFSDLHPHSYKQEGKVAQLIIQGKYEEIYQKLKEKNPILLESSNITFEEFFIIEIERNNYDIDSQELL